MNNNANETAIPRLSQRKITMIIATFALSVLVAAITVDMVNPMLPILSERFAASKSEISWVVSGVALILAIGVPMYGRMSDIFELKKLFIAAVSILSLGSFICALAPNLFVLVMGRMMQGAGMAAIPVLSVVAVSKLLPPGKRGSALGIIAGSIGIGTAGGPIFGGTVGQLWGWQALFWITLLLSTLILVGTLYALPPLMSGIREGECRKFDFLGGTLLGLSAGLLLFGVTQGEAVGFGSVSAIGCLAGSSVALACFVWRIHAADHPFMPPVLFANRYYICSLIVSVCSMFTYFAVLVFVPLLVVEVNGLTPGQAGLVLLPGGAAVAALSPVIGRLSDRVGTKRLIIAGASMMGLSTFFLSTYAAGNSPVHVSAGVLGTGIAFALLNSPANSAAVSSVAKDQVGVGVGIFQGSLYLGAGTGAGLIGAVVSARRGAAHPLNPFYELGAAAYSDAFLITTAAVAVAWTAAWGLRNDRMK